MVFSIAGFDQEHQSMLPDICPAYSEHAPNIRSIVIDVYAYVFMNKVGALIYEQMFKETFGTLGDLSGQLVNWGHIHNIGIRTVTCDMDGSQAKGIFPGIFPAHAPHTSANKVRSWTILMVFR